MSAMWTCILLLVLFAFILIGTIFQMCFIFMPTKLAILNPLSPC